MSSDSAPTASPGRPSSSGDAAANGPTSRCDPCVRFIQLRPSRVHGSAPCEAGTPHRASGPKNVPLAVKALRSTQGDDVAALMVSLHARWAKRKSVCCSALRTSCSRLPRCHCRRNQVGGSSPKGRDMTPHAGALPSAFASPAAKASTAR